MYSRKLCELLNICMYSRKLCQNINAIDREYDIGNPLISALFFP